MEKDNRSTLNLSKQKLTTTKLKHKIMGIQNTTSVLELNLKNNKISDLEVLIDHHQKFIFSDFQNLKKLNISNNPIKNVHPTCFKTNKKIEVLIFQNVPLKKDY